MTAPKNPAGFDAGLDDVFARIAGRYDRLHDVFSFRIHRLWKAAMARRLAGMEGAVLMDAGAGTGDIAARCRDRDGTAARQRIILADASPEMLTIARQRLGEAAPFEYAVCDVHDLDGVADGAIDIYANAFLAKLCHLPRLAAEAHRVLRPGGHFVMLEASRIPFAPLHRAYLVYMSLCLPLIARLAGERDRSVWRYFLRGIRNVDPPDGVAEVLREAGFGDVTWQRLSLGIVALHVARKPSDAEIPAR